jgi:hypothetical protein
MNSPKEKAKELFDKMDNVVGGGNYDAKQYALIAVDEILQGQYISIKLHEIEYWKKVKKEINKL